MNRKLFGLFAATFVAAAAQAQVVSDTVFVKQTTTVDTVVVSKGGRVKTNIITVKEGIDTVTVKIGKRGLYVHEDPTGEVSVWTSKDKQSDKGFHSHLSYVALGMNTYYNSSWKMDFPAGYEGLELNLAKSSNVVINVGVISQPIFGKYFGITAGVGTEWHNYRFSNDVTLVKNRELQRIEVVDLPSDANVLKTKLTDWWLNIPVAFEFNTGHQKSFYMSVGAVGSILINSHTKVVTREDGDKEKDKVWNKTYMNPFRLSLTARAGYSNFGIYATYSLSQLFQDGKGPQLYPFAAGVTFNF